MIQKYSKEVVAENVQKIGRTISGKHVEIVTYHTHQEMEVTQTAKNETWM